MQRPEFSPDTKRLATAHSKTAFVWDLADAGAKSTHDIGFEINGFSFHASSNRLLVVGRNTKPYLIDLRSDAPPLRLNHPREVQRGCISPDGARMATSSSGGVLHVWDRAGNRTPLEFRQLLNNHHVEFSSDSRWLLTGGWDGTARVWEISTDRAGAQAYDFGCGSANNIARPTVGLSPNGEHEVRFDADSVEARVFVRGQDAAPILTLRHSEPLRAAWFTADGRRIATFGAKEVRLWDASSGTPIGAAIAHDCPKASVLLLSDDGSRALILHKDLIAHVWDTASGRRVVPPLGRSVDLDKPRIDRPETGSGIPEIEARINWMSISRNGNVIAMSTRPVSGPVYVCDLAADRYVAIPTISGFVHSIALAPRGDRIAVGGSDTRARIYDVRTGELVSPPMKHPSFVNAVQFSPDGHRLVTGCRDLKVRVWDAASGDLLVPGLSGAGRARAVWFDRAGKRVIADDGEPRQWALPTFAADAELTPALVRLLSSRRIDETEGIDTLRNGEFRENVELYQSAWRSWAMSERR